MYFCRICGNKKHFTEHNLIETDLHIDEKTGKIKCQCDHFQECTEVVCYECKASSNDGNVVNRKTGERL